MLVGQAPGDALPIVYHLADGMAELYWKPDDPCSPILDRAEQSWWKPQTWSGNSYFFLPPSLSPEGFQFDGIGNVCMIFVNLLILRVSQIIPQSASICQYGNSLRPLIS